MSSKANYNKTLTKTQCDDLVNNIVDNSPVLKLVNKLYMNKSTVELPVMLSDTILEASKGGLEDRPPVDLNNAVTLYSTKLKLPWTVTAEFMENEPSKGYAEKRIQTVMNVQAGNDLEDIFINGDEDSTDILYRANDGVLKLSKNNHKVQVGIRGKAVTKMFEEVLRALPTKYRRNLRQLKFIVSPDMWMDYVMAIASRQGSMADQYLAGLVGSPTYGGVEVVASSFMPYGKFILTNPNNLIFGFENTIKKTRTHDKENDEYNYLLDIRVDFAIQNPEALIVGIVTSTRTARLYNRINNSMFGRFILKPLGALYKLVVRKPARKLARLLNKL